jgi:hypothetical protein
MIAPLREIIGSANGVTLALLMLMVAGRRDNEIDRKWYFNLSQVVFEVVVCHRPAAA